MITDTLILERVQEIKKTGHGSVLVQIRDGQVQEIDTTKKERVPK